MLTASVFLHTTITPLEAVAQIATRAESAPEARGAFSEVPNEASEEPAQAPAVATVARPSGDPELADSVTSDRGDGTAVVHPGLATASPVEPGAVDPSNVDPGVALALPTGPAKSGVTSQSISVPTGAGSIKGMDESFSAQLSTGIATFNVPFALPSARGRAQPTLALSYASSGGFGLAGVGWNVGVPFIARQTDRGVPRYNDVDASGVSLPYDVNWDRFVYNGGQELVPICTVSGGQCLAEGAGSGALPGETMPVWADGHVYFRPRVEGSFLRFFLSPDRLTWRVQSKSGVTLEMGVPLDGSGYDRALERNPDNPNEIYRWCLVRQYDTYGDANVASATSSNPVNKVVYRYFQDGGKAYLTDIFDTTPEGDATTADLRTYAHHTHLQYEPRTDPTRSYRSGWQIAQRLRLKSVTAASKTFDADAGDPSDARELVRRYHLEYDAAHHVSLLKSLQVEGRCAPIVEVSRTEQCDDPAGCVWIDKAYDPDCVLPPMTFEHGHVGLGTILEGSNGVIGGYEEVDETVHRIDASPGHSIDEGQSDFFDINGDALPDVLVTAPGLFNGKHGLFLNSLDPAATPGAAGAQLGYAPTTICVDDPDVPNVDANVLQLTNDNVQPLDLDANGIVDLVHMPRVKRYEIFSPIFDGAKSEWCWDGRPIATADDQSPKIDFTNDEPNTRALDANFDGLVDIVVSAGTEMQTFFSLGRYPNGDGQFGEASLATASTSNIVTDPVTACVPWSASPVRFSDEDVRVGDMNGDGISDIVRIRSGDVRYWPGRGNGFWGTGARDDCPAGTFGQDRHVAMAASPYYQVAQGGSLLLDDVNGDGLADLLEVRFDAVDIYINVDGVSWTERHVLFDTPPNPAHAQRVRLVDINGSGTRDIVWGDGFDFKYIDLQRGRRPWLLTRVDNGLGKSIDLEYGTSTEEMLAAERDGNPWERKMPTVVQVVKRVTESDNITVAGRPPGVYVTQYSYRDPVYEGRQREFRGFSSTTTERIGDANSPTDVTETQFLLGECIDEATRAPCPTEDRWRDNPREALKGLPFLTARADKQGTFLTTVHMGYRLRELYTGLDGRVVRHAFEAHSQRFLYDTGPFVSSRGPPSQPVRATVELEAPLGAVVDDTPAAFQLESTSGTARVDMEYVVDEFGNRVEAVAKGCVGEAACPTRDEEIRTETVPGRPNAASEPTGWLWRTVESRVTGEPSRFGPRHGARNETFVSYNLQGDPTLTQAQLSDGVALDRFHESGNASDVAPPPPTSSGNGVRIDVSLNNYDELGNLTEQLAQNGRCRTVSYDLAYRQLPTLERIATGGDSASGLDVGNCDDAVLMTQATYDRGYELIDTAIDFTGQVTLISYDAFSRLGTLTRPVADAAGPNPPVGVPPSVRVTYTLPPATGGSFSIIHYETQDRAIAASDYLESYAYVDGFGRTIALVNEADATAGDTSDWIVSGLVEYDNKSAIRRRYLDFFVGQPPDQLAFQQPVDAPYRRQRYDAFGRQLQAFDLDGTVVSQSTYHALAADLADAADIRPGPHQGTPTTERRDGHGRAVEVRERFDEGGSTVTRLVLTQYLQTNEPEVITRRNDLTGEQVVRWFRYDTFGRMVLNVEPNSSVGFTTDVDADATPAPNGLKAWRYAYNNFGDLVGTSDARGCGVNYSYDGAGRLVTEDYSPCLHVHAPYSPPDLAARTGVEVLYQYDDVPTNPPGMDAPFGSHGGIDPDGRIDVQLEPRLLKGRQVAVWDRGSVTFTSYDGRGRVGQVAARVALPPNPGAPIGDFADRYARRWYQRTFGYDAADREVVATTGASVPELLGSDVNGHQSAVTTSYSDRGIVLSVGGSYGGIVTHVTRDADGLHREIVRGDAAQTATSFRYDDRRRLRSVQTYRAAPALWSDASYPAPGPLDDPTQQLLLEDRDLAYDIVNNPTEIRDWRNPAEWPDGAKPVTKRLQYDDLYRISRVDYDYAPADDSWTSPYERENAEAAGGATPDPRRGQPSPHVDFSHRVRWQTFRYDWLGNNVLTDDDAHGFYDRSIGTIQNGTASSGPYQLLAASNTALAGPTDSEGELETRYDAAGNLAAMKLRRAGSCLPAGAECSQRFDYEWDEVGRLVRARRWDLLEQDYGSEDLDGSPPALPPAADLRYQYDATDRRVIKQAVDGAGGERSAVYVFDTLELRGAAFVAGAPPDPGDYALAADTEVPYLLANGSRVARVHFEDTGVPMITGSARHVLLELSDHLGSTSVVLDKETGELVERTTFQVFGASESDYRPDRWESFREDYRFTGKEEDIEIGLVYFGRRFYSPATNRWASLDPASLHSLTQDLNGYAYVGGRVGAYVDPDGAIATALAAAFLVGFVAGASIEATRQVIHNQSISLELDEILGAGLVSGVGATVGAGLGGAVGVGTVGAGTAVSEPLAVATGGLASGATAELGRFLIHGDPVQWDQVALASAVSGGTALGSYYVHNLYMAGKSPAERWNEWSLRKETPLVGEIPRKDASGRVTTDVVSDVSAVNREGFQTGNTGAEFALDITRAHAAQNASVGNTATRSIAFKIRATDLSSTLVRDALLAEALGPPSFGERYPSDVVFPGRDKQCAEGGVCIFGNDP